ncbi:MAG: protein kinase, partial [Dehalococcoidia bacterium]|nr:protein kinase [Dehalococcoidia bacterium]
QIGRYRILEQIAAGSQGIVYRAFSPDTNRVVAVKVLHPNFAADETYICRFQREATIASSIDHPNIIRIFEVGEDDGHHFMVMELVPENLDNLIHVGLPISSAAKLTAQIADGLQVAHQSGIVHRDIKPQNILIGQDGVPKVTDFGIARSELMSVMTATGVLMGTPYYMSPEQARGDHPDQRSDVYSLGCLFYQLLTGALPFNASTPLVVLRLQIEDEPRPIREVRPDTPAGVAGIVEQAMEKDPDLRYQSMAQMADAIRQVVPMEPAAAAEFQQMEPVAAPSRTEEVPTPASTTNSEIARLEREVAAMREELGASGRVGVGQQPAVARSSAPRPYPAAASSDQRIGILKQLVGLSGRINRRGYIGRIGLIWAILIVGAALAEDPESQDLGNFLMGFGWIFGIVVGFCAAVRRFHDFGWSGWRLLLALIPFVVIIIGFIILFRRSDWGSNGYGAEPRGWGVGI